MVKNIRRKAGLPELETTTTENSEDGENKILFSSEGETLEFDRKHKKEKSDTSSKKLQPKKEQAQNVELVVAPKTKKKSRTPMFGRSALKSAKNMFSSSTRSAPTLTIPSVRFESTDEKEKPANPVTSKKNPSPVNTAEGADVEPTDSLSRDVEKPNKENEETLEPKIAATLITPEHKGFSVLCRDKPPPVDTQCDGVQPDDSPSKYIQSPYTPKTPAFQAFSFMCGQGCSEYDDRAENKSVLSDDGTWLTWAQNEGQLVKETLFDKMLDKLMGEPVIEDDFTAFMEESVDPEASIFSPVSTKARSKSGPLAIKAAPRLATKFDDVLARISSKYGAKEKNSDETSFLQSQLGSVLEGEGSENDETNVTNRSESLPNPNLPVDFSHSDTSTFWTNDDSYTAITGGRSAFTGGPSAFTGASASTAESTK